MVGLFIYYYHLHGSGVYLPGWLVLGFPQWAKHGAVDLAEVGFILIRTLQGIEYLFSEDYHMQLHLIVPQARRGLPNHGDLCEFLNLVNVLNAQESLDQVVVDMLKGRLRLLMAEPCQDT